jgi:hypothetical protein
MFSVAVKARRCMPAILTDLCRAERKFHLVNTANRGDDWESHGQGADCSDISERSSAKFGLGAKEREQQMDVNQKQLQGLIEEFKLDKTVRKLCGEHLISGIRQSYSLHPGVLGDFISL